MGVETDVTHLRPCFFTVLLLIGFTYLLILIPLTALAWEESSHFGVLEKVDGKNYHCDANYSWTKQAPFMISDSFKNDGTLPKSGRSYEHNWDNFRYISDSDGVIGFLPQRSVVRLINQKHQSYRDDQTFPKYTRLPVEVVSVPENDGHKFMETYHMELQKILKSDLDSAKAGSVGRIDARSLQPAGQFTYIISRPTFLTQVVGLDDTEAGRAKAVQLVTRGEDDDTEYEARKCCLGGDRSQCVYKYRWKILDNQLDEMGDFELNPFGDEGNDCGIMKSLRPVDKDQARPLLEFLEAIQANNANATIDDIEYVDSMGLVRFPFDHVSEDGFCAVEGPFNSSHYETGDACSTELYTDNFINVTSGCALTSVLKEWQNRYPSSRDEIQIGNMWHPKTWNVHSTHELSCDKKNTNCHSAQGTCIDIRPLSTDSARAGVTTGSGNYSRSRTREFIQLLRAAGADRVFFDGSRIPEANAIGGHADHIHVCFNPSNESVQNACAYGI